MAINAGAIALELGLDTAPISKQVKTAAADIQTKLGSAFNGVNSQINSTANFAQSKLGGAFKKLGMMLASAFALQKLIAFGQECINLGSDLAEVENVVDTAFPSMEARVDSFAESCIEAFGMSTKVAKQYLGTFGAMSKSFGFAEEEAFNMSAALTGLAGDVASFYNISTDLAYIKLKSVFSGETETLKDLGVVMTQSALDQYALANGYGKTTAKMTEQEKVALRFKFVQEQLSLASGDFIKTQDSWANQTRILSLRFDELKASVGNGLIAVFSPVLQIVNALLARINALASAIQSLFSAGKKGSSTGQAVGEIAEETDNVQQSAGGAGKALKTLMGFDQLNRLDGGSGGGGGGSADSGIDIGDTSIIDEENLSDDVKRLEQVLRQCRDIFKSYFKDMPKLEINIDQNKLKDNLESALLSIAQILGAWGSFVITIAIDVANDLDIGKLINNLSDLTTAGLSLGAAMSNAVTPALIEFYQAGISPVVECIGGKLADAMSFFSGIANSWAAWFTDNKDKIVAFGKALGDAAGTIETFLEPLGNAAWEAFKAAISAISDALQVFGDWFLNNSDAVCAALTAIVAGMVAYKTAVAISSIIKALTTAMTGLSVAQGLVTVAQDALNAVMSINPIGLIVAAIAAAVAVFLYFWNTSEGFRNFWIGLWDGIKNAVSAVIDWLKPALSSAGDFFVGLWNGIKNGATAVADFFSGICTGITTAVSAVWNSVTEFLSPAVEWFTALFTDIYNTLASIILVIANIVRGLWEIIKQVFEAASEWFNETVIEPVAQFFSVLWGGISQAALTAWNFIKDAWGQASAWLNDTIITPVSEFFRGLWESVTSGAGSAWNGIKSVFSAVASFFEATFKGAWEKVKNVFSTGGKIFDGIKDGVVSAFKSIVNKIISGINTVVSVPFKAINTALNKIRGVNILGITPFSGLGSIGVPKIPMLAQGGYVKANTPQLAMIGDNRRYGEIVAPEDKMLEMVLTALKLFKQQEGNSKSGASNESHLIELVVNIGGETLARKIIKLLKEQNRRGNKLEFDF